MPNQDEMKSQQTTDAKTADALAKANEAERTRQQTELQQRAMSGVGTPGAPAVSVSPAKPTVTAAPAKATSGPQDDLRQSATRGVVAAADPSGAPLGVASRPKPNPMGPELALANQTSLDAENRPKGLTAQAQAEAMRQPGVPNAEAAGAPLIDAGPGINPPTNPDLPTVFPTADQNLHGLPALPIDTRHPNAATQAGTRPTAQPGGGVSMVQPEAQTQAQRRNFQRLEALAKGASLPPE